MQNRINRNVPLMTNNPITFYHKMKPNSEAVVSNEAADDSNAVAALNTIMDMLYELDPKMVFMLSAVSKALHYSIYEGYGKQIFPSLYGYHRSAMRGEIKRYYDASIKKFRDENKINDGGDKALRNSIIVEVSLMLLMSASLPLLVWQKGLPLNERNSSLVLMSYVLMALGVAAQPFLIAYLAASECSRRALEKREYLFSSALVDKLNSIAESLPENLTFNEAEWKNGFDALINAMEAAFPEVVLASDVVIDDVEAQQGSLSDEEMPLLRVSRR